MRILISAYACEPGKGSEPEVGLRVVLAAARDHEVWVITRENNLAALRSFLRGHPLEDNIELVGLELSRGLLWLKRLGGLVTLNFYYQLWQRRLRSVALDLDEKIGFDVVHHVTFAAYWSLAGAAAVPRPFVWGPVGGGVKPPLRLLTVMGFLGAFGDLIRVMSRPLIGRLSAARETAEKARVIVAQNFETRAAIGCQERTVVLPNGLLAAESLTDRAIAHSGESDIVAAGRLVGWKGYELAIRAMIDLPERVLHVYGDGPDRERLERLASRLGVGNRVVFEGRAPRERVLGAIADAGVFLHPSLHEDSGLAVVEALALGTPVVCLNRGGPPVLLGYWPRVPSRAVEPSSAGETAQKLAEAIEEVVGRRVDPDASPATHFVNDLLDIYQRVGTT